MYIRNLRYYMDMMMMIIFTLTGGVLLINNECGLLFTISKRCTLMMYV